MAEACIPLLVSCHWLKDQLGEPSQTRAVMLDSSWNPVYGGQEDYNRKHIPGAQFLDLNKGVRSTPLIPWNLPEPQAFEEYVQSLGVSTDSHVVVYDRLESYMAARAWWMFKLHGYYNVSLLDGGLDKWEADGYETATGQEPEPKRGNFRVKSVDDKLLVDYDAMLKIVKSGSVQIVDARQPEHFHGVHDEPSIFTQLTLKFTKQPQPGHMATGRMPGSTLLNWLEVLDPHTKCLLPTERLHKVLEDKGIELSKPLVTTCYIGNAACLLALVAQLCGKQDTQMYYGSWTEYAQRVDDESLVVRDGAVPKI